jgi:peptidoglycan hydrolase-like protein with peptidoglycan-binding domain
MKSLHVLLFVSLLFATAAYAQNSNPPTDSAAESRSASAKRGPVFKANKAQVVAAQTLLKTKGKFAGEATGTLDPATREAIKAYQQDHALRSTGTLNRATLEKMGVELTEKQKAIPASANSYASADAPKRRKARSSGTAPDEGAAKRAVFRATKDQIAEAQKLMKNGGMYSGEESGKLDDPTRDGLKKYQESKGLKVTGTLNQLTLEKMGIALTDKQKGVE